MAGGVGERWFGPAEMAERLGVSPKALRVYERAGLVRPHRTGAGWRVYGPDQQARLHQVLALKRLGLSLARVGELLAGKLASLDAVLALQQQVLESRRAETDRGLALLAAARAKLARDGALSPDDLTHLTRETAMSETMTDLDWSQTFDPLAEKHLSPEEIRAIQSRHGDFDPEKVARDWDALITEGKALMAKGDPSSPEAADHARRWMAQVSLTTGGDTAVTQKVGAMWMDAFKDPDFREKSPMSPELMQFVGEAYRRAQA